MNNNVYKNNNHFLTMLDRVNDCCDFLHLFVSTLYINNDTYFYPTKLINFIDECKQKNKYSNLLNNIYIKDDKYNSFNKAITILKMDKDIRIFKYQSNNPTEYIIIINKSIDLKDSLIRNNQKKITEMTNFIDDYHNFVNQAGNIKHKYKIKVKN